jgi:hypothetical protein
MITECVAIVAAKLRDVQEAAGRTAHELDELKHKSKN